MKNELGLKILLTPLIVLLAIYSLNVGFETYTVAERACYAWSAKTSISCIVSFLPAGLQGALSRDVLFTSLFDGQTVDLVPSPALGFGLLAGWMIFYLTIFAAFVTLVYSIWQRRALVKVEAQKSHLREFALFAFLIFTVGFTGLIYLLLDRHDSNYVETHAVNIANIPPSADSMALRNAIALKIMEDRISAQELEQVIVEGLDNKTIDGKLLVRLFDHALSRCREDLTQVILNHPLQPSPHDYDAKYMRSLYPSVTDPACNRIYKKMGWAAEGCEVSLDGDICASFDEFERKYFAIFVEKHDRLECKTAADCFASESGRCGRAMVGSRLAFSGNDMSTDEKMRCQLSKLKSACIKSNGRHLVCEKLEQASIECKNSFCVSVPVIN